MIEVTIAPPIQKYNQNHDELGRFTFSSGGGAAMPTTTATKSSRPTFDSDFVREQIVSGDAESLSEISTNPTYKVTDPETGQDYHVKELDNSELANELTAKNIAKELDADEFVPEITDIGGGMVATEWIEGKPLYNVSEAELEAAFANMSDAQLTKLVGTEMALANFDRNGGNAMLSDDGRIILIDNGISFSKDAAWADNVLGDPGASATIQVVREFASNRTIDKGVLASMSDNAATTNMQRVMTDGGVGSVRADRALSSRMLTTNNVARNPGIQTWDDAFKAHGG
jgi:hypothetical protein